MTTDLVDVSQVRAAAARIGQHVVRTPLLRPPFFSVAIGADVWLKAECLQITGAFKIRGATNRVATAMASSPAPRRFVTASSGNHAQAVAWAARSAGVPATVVMPETASDLKVRATERAGARIVKHGRFADERKKRARELAEEPGSVYIDPTDDPDVIAGQGTIGLEVCEDLPEIDAIVAPIGGGGLISGIAVAVKALRPSARVIGVEPIGSASMRASILVGRPVALPEVASAADGLLIREPGALPFGHVRALVDDIVLVSEDEILDTMALVAERAKLVVEPSGCVSLAAGLAGRIPLPRGRGSNVVFVLSGGNVALPDYARWLSEPLRAFGRLA